MTWSAPIATARSRLAALDEVTITRAPAARASWSPKIDTPPVPWTSTVSPARSCAASNSAWYAVTPAHGKLAAASNDRRDGSRTHADSGSTTSSASMPSWPPPSARAW